MKIKFSHLFAAFCAATVLFVFGGFTQLTYAQENVLNTYAITNARIVTVSGDTLERGTIVIRNGLIQAVGANIQAPADARVIDGAGLTVYPGFFDSNTSLGIGQRQTQQAPGTAPAQPQQQQQTQQSNSSFPAGLQPEVSAAELIRPSDTAFETARNNGFTTALVVPRERVFVGQSVLINLAGETAAQSILRSPVAHHVAFQPLVSGQFPSSLMGSFAAVRQMLLDAQRLQTARAAYEKAPRGQRRPEDNKSLEALFPVLNGQVPVVFQADTEREIVRALDLAQEFKLKAIISGALEAYKVADRLRTQNVPVLLTMNFPKRTATVSPEADPESMEILRFRAEAPRAAARLAQARVRFALHSGGMTNLTDFWNNANKAVESGLGRGDALRAMTLGAADIFGVADRTGSIEPGKIANLTVTRGDVFDRTRTFTHVFVDGRMFEIRQPAARQTAAAAPGATPAATTPGTTTPAETVNLTGTWNLTIEIPNQTTPVTLRLTQQGNQITGTMESPFGTSEITRGEITTEGFRLVTMVTIGENVEVVITGRVTGNQMSGTATTPQGAAPFTGTRTPQAQDKE